MNLNVDPKNVAFIPVRGGSKAIPLKNIRTICGRPLVYWTAKAACGCKYIDKVYVATDSEDIRKVVKLFKTGQESAFFSKMEVIGRSEKSASDSAPTELAMLEFAENYEFNSIALVQATSPLLMSCDLDRGFEMYSECDVDSVISVVPQKRFHWKCDEDGVVYPSNYDVFNRPRRQEFEGYLVENGAFYITSKKDLLKSRNRVSGKIKAIEMKEDTFFEIDEPSDWLIIEALMKKHGLSAPLEIPDIKLFLTDCDGCLTDGGMYYSERGDELKKFNARDGMGFALLRKKGIITGIITSENAALIKKRAEKLNLDIVEMGCKDKLETVRRICREWNINLKNVAFIGDDINDIELIKNVGFGCCPADAMPQIKGCSDFVTEAKGGRGVIREIVDMIISKGSSCREA